MQKTILFIALLLLSFAAGGQVWRRVVRPTVTLMLSG